MRLIVLPGLDGTGELSAPLSACLGRSHDVVLFRYPGNLFRYDDIARWLEPQSGSGDYAIIAESFSGPLAIRMALANPIGLKALVLVTTFARAPRRVPAFAATVLYLLPIRSELMIRLGQWFLVGKWGATDFPEAFAKIVRAVPRRSLVGRLREVLSVSLVEVLDAIRAPRLLVAAAQDRLVPASRVKDFRTAGWTVETVEGPHFLNLTRPEAVARRIEVFLAAI